jgi:hypothetical protein
MSDFIVFGSIVFAVGICMLLFSMFHIYRGLHGTLSDAHVGEVYNFEYLQPDKGEPERFLVKVVDVHTLSDDQISKLNARSNYRKNDSVFQRTRHLITGESADGTIRNFYAERAVNCRRPLLGGALFKVGVAHLF